MSALTNTQKRCLGWIAAGPWPNDHACNCEGDLTIRSANWPATAHSLLRRGLIEKVEVHFQHQEDEHYAYAITDAGDQAILDCLRPAPSGDEG